jgi:hypothetical protein
MKKMLTILSLTITEMQIKTTLKFYLIPVRIATIRTPLATNVGEDAGRKEPSYTAGGNVSCCGTQYGGFLKN